MSEWLQQVSGISVGAHLPWLEENNGGEERWVDKRGEKRERETERDCCCHKNINIMNSDTLRCNYIINNNSLSSSS